MGSIEGCDDQESVCSSNDREGDAFPKAFERELVTPTNLQKTHNADSTESDKQTSGNVVDGQAQEIASVNVDDETKESKNECKTYLKTVNEPIFMNFFVSVSSNVTTDEIITTPGLGTGLRTLEERRKSLLDHHWAIPSKDRFVIYSFSNCFSFFFNCLVIIADLWKKIVQLLRPRQIHRLQMLQSQVVVVHKMT